MRRLLLALIAVVAITPGCRSDDPVVHNPASSTSIRPLLELRVEVRGGEVTGGVVSDAVEAGRPIRLTVTSDVADVLIVTGTPRQDGSYQLDAGAAFTLDAVAAKRGVIEARLERQQLVAAALTVR